MPAKVKRHSQQNLPRVDKRLLNRVDRHRLLRWWRRHFRHPLRMARLRSPAKLRCPRRRAQRPPTHPADLRLHMRIPRGISNTVRKERQLALSSGAPPRQDGPSAKKFFEQADREISFLEKFLGH